ncbi:hypothetical protein BLNAU_12560 [Blattamonas nauphoetae]|uniref:PUM-HD domain-containing protein n=1 Tax=Blattamonas nauphoetae TaxID=2049346 RepID=A0ABQ9XLT3_9EUKA|nr:hypothetical protein BLNAU_12560 [Blattamonas nauphoetae]
MSDSVLFDPDHIPAARSLFDPSQTLEETNSAPIGDKASELLQQHSNTTPLPTSPLLHVTSSHADSYESDTVSTSQDLERDSFLYSTFFGTRSNTADSFGADDTHIFPRSPIQRPFSHHPVHDELNLFAGLSQTSPRLSFSSVFPMNSFYDTPPETRQFSNIHSQTLHDTSFPHSFAHLVSSSSFDSPSVFFHSQVNSVPMSDQLVDNKPTSLLFNPIHITHHEPVVQKDPINDYSFMEQSVLSSPLSGDPTSTVPQNGRNLSKSTTQTDFSELTLAQPLKIRALSDSASFPHQLPDLKTPITLEPRPNTNMPSQNSTVKTEQDALLAQFKDRKYNISSFTFDTLKTHVLSFCTDSFGSRMVQQLISSEATFDITTRTSHLEGLLEEIGPSLPLIICDHFGNYVVQAIIKSDIPKIVGIVAAVVEANLISFSNHLNACRVVQTLIPFLPPTTLKAFAAILFPETIDCITHKMANHVLQVLITHVDPSLLSTPVSLILQNHIPTISKHQYGCRVIETLIFSTNPTDFVLIADSIYPQLKNMSNHESGVFVVQCFLGERKVPGLRKRPIPDELLERMRHDSEEMTKIREETRKKVMDWIIPQVIVLSERKYSSILVEEAILCANDDERKQIVSELLKQKKSKKKKKDATQTAKLDSHLSEIDSYSSLTYGRSLPTHRHHLVHLLQSEHGNFLVQTLLSSLGDSERAMIIDSLIPYLPFLAAQAGSEKAQNRINEIRKKISEPQQHPTQKEPKKPPKNRRSNSDFLLTAPTAPTRTLSTVQSASVIPVMSNKLNRIGSFSSGISSHSPTPNIVPSPTLSEEDIVFSNELSVAPLISTQTSLGHSDSVAHIHSDTVTHLPFFTPNQPTTPVSEDIAHSPTRPGPIALPQSRFLSPLSASSTDNNSGPDQKTLNSARETESSSEGSHSTTNTLPSLTSITPTIHKRIALFLAALGIIPQVYPKTLGFRKDSYFEAEMEKLKGRKGEEKKDDTPKEDEKEKGSSTCSLGSSAPSSHFVSSLSLHIPPSSAHYTELMEMLTEGFMVSPKQTKEKKPDTSRLTPSEVRKLFTTTAPLKQDPPSMEEEKNRIKPKTNTDNAGFVQISSIPGGLQQSKLTKESADMSSILHPAQPVPWIQPETHSPFTRVDISSTPPPATHPQKGMNRLNLSTPPKNAQELNQTQNTSKQRRKTNTVTARKVLPLTLTHPTPIHTMPTTPNRSQIRNTLTNVTFPPSSRFPSPITAVPVAPQPSHHAGRHQNQQQDMLSTSAGHPPQFSSSDFPSFPFDSFRSATLPGTSNSPTSVSNYPSSFNLSTSSFSVCDPPSAPSTHSHCQVSHPQSPPFTPLSAPPDTNTHPHPPVQLDRPLHQRQSESSALEVGSSLLFSSSATPSVQTHPSQRAHTLNRPQAEDGHTTGHLARPVLDAEIFKPLSLPPTLAVSPSLPLPTQFSFPLPPTLTTGLRSSSTRQAPKKERNTQRRSKHHPSASFPSISPNTGSLLPSPSPSLSPSLPLSILPSPAALPSSSRTLPNRLQQPDLASVQQAHIDTTESFPKLNVTAPVFTPGRPDKN